MAGRRGRRCLPAFPFCHPAILLFCNAMSSPELVVVHTFSDQFAADVAKTALDAAGIECFVRSDDAGGEYPGLAIGRGAQLIVRAEDAMRANEILTSEDLKI